MKSVFFLWCFLFVVSTISLPLDAKTISINVMAPLVVGNIHNPDSAQSQRAWKSLEKGLTRLKKIGVEAISTDVWWGAVESSERSYSWKYYDKWAELLKKLKLRWVPIMSFHQLGGNVGDTGSQPIPSWIWSKGYFKNLKTKSEQGNESIESVSVWGTPYILTHYRRFLSAFQARYSKYASIIDEINIGLGPAGELRYPSYNQHDQGSGYPARGALQCYSALAIQSFRNYVQKKYGTIQKVNNAWRFKLKRFSQVYPPNPRQMNSFFRKKEQFTSYGKDFFDWYNQSLINHGESILKTALNVFNKLGAPFRGIAIGAKIPGIHWRIAIDRLAELSAGLIRTSYPNWMNTTYGHGYKHTLDLFKRMNQYARSNFPYKTPKVILHFTALEMSNYRDGQRAGSRAKSLVFWIGRYARNHGIPIKGENALAGELFSAGSWYNISDALRNSSYQGITFLRYDTFMKSPTPFSYLWNFIKKWKRK